MIIENFKNVIVIGASAGGIGAISKVIAGISNTIDATVIIVLHVSSNSNAKNITAIFQRHTTLTCHVAANGMIAERGHLYLAPPEHQLMIKGGQLIVNQGTHENKYRPSIDVLFRSAAVNYGNRAVGTILTGMLEDGTSGMYAIKSCGGICIVQDPAEAEFSDMPRSVMNKIAVDYQATSEDIPEIIREIVKIPLIPAKPAPVELQIEADLTERMMSDINDLKKMADQSDYVCPDCGGGLWAVKNDPMHRYRCHTGHVYSEKLLNELQDRQIEESLWVCIRMLEERVNLLLLMLNRDGNENSLKKGASLQRRVDIINSHISRLKSFLSLLTEDLYNPKAKTDLNI